jgi:hypothetical protein
VHRVSAASSRVLNAKVVPAKFVPFAALLPANVSGDMLRMLSVPSSTHTHSTCVGATVSSIGLPFPLDARRLSAQGGVFNCL